MAARAFRKWLLDRWDGLGAPPAEAPATALELRGHIVGLDVLRGAAVLAVLFDHAYANATDYAEWRGAARFWIALTGMGHLGVHLFFILSGFLITGILYDGKQGRGGGARPGAPQTFYKRRMRRILPAYLVLLLLLRLTHLVDGRFVLAGLLFVINMGRLVGARLSQYSYVWSLAVEEQFYLVWPWIVWRASSRTILRTILACLVLAPLLRLGLALAGQDSYFKTWVNLDYLMYGALVASLLRSGALHAGNLARIRRGLYLGATVGMLLSAGLWAVASNTLWALVLFNAVGRTPELALFVAWLLGALIAHQGRQAPASNPASAPRRPLARSLAQVPARALIFLGNISYGLYLVHMLVYRLYDRQVAGTALARINRSFPALTLRAVACSGISILLAWLSRSTLEALFLGRPSRAQTPARVPVPPRS